MAKILIIDDEEMIRTLYKEALIDAGYEVILAANGQEALKILDVLIPDLMLLDIEMPFMTGPELMVNLRRLALRRPELATIPYLILTGKDYKNEIENFGFKKDPGFIKYITKMTPTKEIVRLLDTLFREKEL